VRHVLVILVLVLPLSGCSAWKPMKPPLEPSPGGRTLPDKVEEVTVQSPQGRFDRATCNETNRVVSR
jgi:hypothetical protein